MGLIYLLYTRNSNADEGGGYWVEIAKSSSFGDLRDLLGRTAMSESVNSYSAAVERLCRWDYYPSSGQLASATLALTTLLSSDPHARPRARRDKEEGSEGKS